MATETANRCDNGAIDSDGKHIQQETIHSSPCLLSPGYPRTPWYRMKTKEWKNYVHDVLNKAFAWDIDIHTLHFGSHRILFITTVVRVLARTFLKTVVG